MTVSGENRSIYFDGDRLEKIEKIIDVYKERTGVRLTRSQIVNRAIDALFLIECPSDRTDSIAESQAAA